MEMFSRSRLAVLLLAVTAVSSLARPIAVHAQNVVTIGQGANSDLATAVANAGNGGTVIVPSGYSETIRSAVLIPQSNLKVQCQSGSSFALGVSLGAPSFPGTAIGMITVQSGGSLSMD